MTESSLATHRLTVLARRELTESLVELTLSRPKTWHFEAGQFARLGVDVAGFDEPQFRAYSVASAPTDDTLLFLVKVIEGGTVSPVLANKQVGETILLEGEAQGNLLVERLPGGDNLWYIATGAGLAPFLSMMRSKRLSGLDNRTETLVIGARTVKECDALIELSRRIAPDIFVVGATTREPSSLTGRLPALLESGELEKAAGRTIEAETTRVLLCGNPDAMKAMRAIFKTRGLVAPRFGKPGQLLVEALW